MRAPGSRKRRKRLDAAKQDGGREAFPMKGSLNAFRLRMVREHRFVRAVGGSGTRRKIWLSHETAHVRRLTRRRDPSQGVSDPSGSAPVGSIGIAGTRIADSRAGSSRPAL